MPINQLISGQKRGNGFSTFAAKRITRKRMAITGIHGAGFIVNSFLANIAFGYKHGLSISLKKISSSVDTSS